jgi:hypothetical protein
MGYGSDPGTAVTMTRAGYTRPDEISTNAGTRVAVQYEVVASRDIEADEFRKSQAT